MYNLDKILERIKENNERYEELRYFALPIEEALELFMQDRMSGRVKYPSIEELRSCLD